VLCVCDTVSDDVLEEDLEYPACLFVDETCDTLDATSACKTSDGGLRDALDVIAQDLAVTKCTALA
jgi:hypothetical protein